MDRVRKDDRNKLIPWSKVSACRKLMSIRLKTSRIFKRKISPSVGRSIEGSWLVLRRRIETTIEQVRIILFPKYYVFFRQKKRKRKKRRKKEEKGRKERISSNNPGTVVVHVLQTVREDQKLKDERNLQSGRTGNGKGWETRVKKTT